MAKHFFGMPHRRIKKKPAKISKLGGQRIFESPKSKAVKTKKGEKVKYQYSIIQSKDSRLKTFSNKEEAIIRMNKLKEAQPSSKYRLLTEKKPGRGW